MDHKYRSDVDFAKTLDECDPLSKFRDRFYIEEDTIYMCGNSLGLLSKDSEECLLTALKDWKMNGVGIWGVKKSKYFLYATYLGAQLASLINAEDNEVVITGCVTSNIHQAIGTFYRPTATRYKVLVDDINFPTDRYAVDCQVRLKGYDPAEAVKVVRSVDGFMHEDKIIAAMTEDVALILLPAVYYTTAQIIDMKRITEAAKMRNILIGWDLCHAIGAIEVDLKGLDADFAVLCTYKYLNSGPGAVAGLYINRKHFHRLPSMTGWYGNKKETQFLLRQEFEHQKDAGGWQLGTPHLISMASLEGSLRIVKEAGLSEMRRKSLNLTAYLIYLVDEKLLSHGFRVVGLRDDSRRGGHVSLKHEEAHRISMDLKSRGIVVDYRDPNLIRIAPTALYNTYYEVYEIVDTLTKIVQSQSYKTISHKRDYVV